MRFGASDVALHPAAAADFSHSKRCAFFLLLRSKLFILSLSLELLLVVERFSGIVLQVILQFHFFFAVKLY